MRFNPAARYVSESVCSYPPIWPLRPLEVVSGQRSNMAPTLPLALTLTITQVVRPPARCYHTAALWEGAPPAARGAAARGGAGAAPMLVFGGAGAGESGHENLLGDVWCACFAAAAPRAATAPAPAVATVAPLQLTWRRLQPRGAAPPPRSSHICAPVPSWGALLVHGGLTTEGVLGDTWMLRGAEGDRSAGSMRGGEGGGEGGETAGEWVELQTSGAPARRAHHSGGVVRETTLLVFSGQVPPRPRARPRPRPTPACTRPAPAPAPALHPPCTRPAPALHPPCTRPAPALHPPCTLPIVLPRTSSWDRTRPSSRGTPCSRSTSTPSAGRACCCPAPAPTAASTRRSTRLSPVKG